MNNITPVDDEWITDAEWRAMSGFSKGKTANDRWRKQGVPFYRISSRCIRYRRSECIAYLTKFRVETNNDAGKGDHDEGSTTRMNDTEKIVAGRQQHIEK